MIAGIPFNAWAVWGIAATATAGVILRPFGWPEFVWAACGAAALVVLGLLPAADALAGIARGTDVYLFLIGMMLLAELARLEGLFAWLAAHAARRARGAAGRLFTLIFAVGTIVTVFLSNDATAVVLTPAVAAAAQAARVPDKLPYLFICAFIANAASFVLPISNPANLVIYGAHMPALLQWLPHYALPSALSIGATYLMLRLTQRRHLRGAICVDIAVPRLSRGGAASALGIVGTAGVLMGCSAFGAQLGLPTFIAGLATLLLVWARSGSGAWRVAQGVAWGVLPLVAGLFVLVQALQDTGLVARLGVLLAEAIRHSAVWSGWGAGMVLGFGCNLINNLPAGLLAGRVVALAHAPEAVRGAVVIGIDLGPNLSVTGSLATILWLGALRREGVNVSFWAFLRVGVVVMPLALLAALGGRAVLF